MAVRNDLLKRTLLLAGACGASLLLMGFLGFGEKKKDGGVDPKDVADMLHAVMDADRAVYTKMVVQRLTLQDKVIAASEHFVDEKALPLPAQMFRMGAEAAAERTAKFSYSLLSLSPINKQNSARTDMERKGLEAIGANKGQNFYGEEKLGQKNYFTAVYPDIAVAEACVKCHNEHKDSPRRDFKLGDVMGAVVIRLPVSE
jgi:hypothetical protein